MVFSDSQDKYIVKSSNPNVFEIPYVSVPEMLANRIAKFDPDLVALVDLNNGNLTYKQLHERTQEFASSLLSFGLTSNDFVMFYGENSIEYIVAMIATIYLGISFCPIPPASGAFELTEQSKGSDGTVLVFGSEKMDVVEKACSNRKYSTTMKQFKVIVQLECEKPDVRLMNCEVLGNARVHSYEEIVKMGTGTRLKSIPHFPVNNLNEDHFLLCFTSGTTGRPKGAIHTHRSIAASIVMADWGDRTYGMPLIMWHPLGHISGTFLIQYALYAGCSVIVFAKSDIEPILDAVSRFKVKSILMSADQATPLATIDYQKKYDLSSLKFFTHGGSVIGTNLLLAIRKKYNVATVNVYGSTEFLSPVDGHGQREVDNYQVGCVGPLKQGVEMKIVNFETGKSMPAMVSGEICFRGLPCFSGYKNNEGATKSTIINGWYHSGDIGHYDEKGNLFITDRIKEMIKYKLYSLMPAEIEDFIHSYEAVAAVCVVGVPHVSAGNFIRAYVQLVEGKEVTEQELIDYVADNMGFQKRLRAGVQFINFMPRTLLGKVDRQHFKRLVKDELITTIVP